MRKRNELISSNDSAMHIRNKDSHYEYSYLQMSVANLQSTSTLPAPLTFTSAQNSPFLAAPAQEYELAIARFSLDTSSLPVFVPIIQLKKPDGTFNTNANQTIYSFTLTYTSGGTTYAYEQFMQWQPQNLSVPTPNPPYLNNPQVQDNSLAYYNAYNVQWVIQLFQNTFNDALIGLNGILTTAGIPSPTSNPPIITYNTDTACCTIYVEAAYYDASPPNTTLTDPIKIYFNSPMYGLLDSFIFTYLGATTLATSGQNYQLIIDSFNGTNQTPLPTIPSTYTATFTSQTTETIGLWSPVQSIIFTSNTLPINQTHILPSVVLLEGQNIGPNSSISNVQNIITSFQSPNNLYRPSITYEPSLYRFISLNGNNQLKLFNIQCYWQDWSGGINNFLLGSQQNFSMLIMFKKIDTY